MRNPIILPKSQRLIELLLVHLHGKWAHCGYKSIIYESRMILDCGSTSHGKTSNKKMCDLQKAAKQAIGAVNGIGLARKAKIKTATSVYDQPIEEEFNSMP